MFWRKTGSWFCRFCPKGAREAYSMEYGCTVENPSVEICAIKQREKQEKENPGLAALFG